MASLSRLPQHLVKQHSYLTPASHWRRATCEEVDCPAWREGFVVDLDERVDPGMGQAQFLRANKAGRRYIEERLEGGLTRFRFTPGQRCLRAAKHRTLNRPGLYVVRAGEDCPAEVTATQWRDDLGETLEHHAIRINRR